MKFWIFIIFNETFLQQSIWICKWCKWVSWWCHRLTIFHVFYIQNCEHFNFFAQTCKSISLYKIYQSKHYSAFIKSWYLRQVLLSHSWNMGYSSILWTKYIEICEAMTSSIHSFAYSCRLFRKCFTENYGNSEFHIFLIRFT